MSVSNLTNTKWVIDEAPSSLTTGTWYINFTSNNSSYASMEMTSSKLYYGNTAVIDYKSGPDFFEAAYRIISITGGTDVTNATLISWLETNATQVPVADLTGTTWTFILDPYVVDVNDAPWHLTRRYEYYIDIAFTSNNQQYIRLYSGDIGENDLYYASAWDSTNDWPDGGIAVQDLNGWLVSDDYKTISITGGTDVTNPDLIVWISQNATQQVTPTGNQYTVTHTLSNVTHGNVSFTIVPGSGYTLPASSADITVTGNGSLVSYDSTTGVVVVSGDDTVAISCECPAAPSGYTVTIDVYYASDGDYSLYDGDTLVRSGSMSDPGDETYDIVCNSGNITIYGGNELYSSYEEGGVTRTSMTDAEAEYTVTGNGSISIGLRCFVKGTQITLADGTTKNVEDITYDDLLLVWDFYQAKLNAAKPCWIMKTKVADHYKKVTLSDGTVLKLVGQGENCHRLFNVTKQKMLYANECVGDEVYKQDGTIVTVLSCEKVYEEVEYYNLTTDTYLDCFANGVLTGSRLNNMYEIKDMKYTSMERLISAEEEQARWETRWKTQKPKC